MRRCHASVGFRTVAQDAGRVRILHTPRGLAVEVDIPPNARRAATPHRIHCSQTAPPYPCSRRSGRFPHGRCCQPWALYRRHRTRPPATRWTHPSPYRPTVAPAGRPPPPPSRSTNPTGFDQANRDSGFDRRGCSNRCSTASTESSPTRSSSSCRAGPRPPPATGRPAVRHVAGRWFARATEPALVAISSPVSILAFNTTGTPCRGTSLAVPSRQPRPGCRAISIAAGLTSSMALSAGSTGADAIEERPGDFPRRALPIGDGCGDLRQPSVWSDRIPQCGRPYTSPVIKHSGRGR